MENNDRITSLLEELNNEIDIREKELRELRETQIRARDTNEWGDALNNLDEYYKERYEPQKEIFMKIDETITKEIFGNFTIWLLGLRYRGKSLNKMGDIKIEFYSSRLKENIIINR